jgi:hypothetical protein
MSSPVFDARVTRAFERMAADLRRVFGDRFVALVASSPTAAAAFTHAVRSDDLDALGAIAENWHRDGLATPLVMTADEFQRSLDTFPAEYQALIDHHVVIDGANPLVGAAVDSSDLRRACEAQARGHLIHLRQGWIEGSSHANRLAHLIEESATPLRRLTNLARLQGESADGDAARGLRQRLVGCRSLVRHSRARSRRARPRLAASRASPAHGRIPRRFRQAVVVHRPWRAQ